MTCGAGLALLGRGSIELTGGSVSCTPDPLWAFVPLRLQFDGVSGSNSFIDSSSSAKSVSIAGGTPVLTDTPSVFGKTVGDFRAINSSISTPWTADMVFGTGPFSLSCHLIIASNGTSSPILRFGENSGARIALTLDAGNNVLFIALSTTGVVLINLTAAVGLPLNTLTHIAVARAVAGGPVVIYVDGIASTSGTPVATFDYNGATLFHCGKTPYSSNPPRWYIRGVDLTIGACRFPGSFAVPDKPICDGAGGMLPVPPPTTVPPSTYTDPLWSSVLFLSAMDLTKINEKTDVAYTLDSAAVTAVNTFDGAGALLCEYPPVSPTSTPFAPSELTAATQRGVFGGCVEFFIRVDSWAAWTSGPCKWANLVQQDDALGEVAWALGIADEGGVPCLQLFSHYINPTTFQEVWKRTQIGAAAPVDGLWHHVAVDFRLSGLTQVMVLYVDGTQQAALTAPAYAAGLPLQFCGQTIFDIVEGVGTYISLPSPALSSTTFDGALDELRVTAHSRYSSNFTAPHYAFSRS